MTSKLEFVEDSIQSCVQKSTNGYLAAPNSYSDVKSLKAGGSRIQLTVEAVLPTADI